MELEQVSIYGYFRLGGKLYEDVLEVFRAAKDVQIVGVYDEFPL